MFNQEETKIEIELKIKEVKCETCDGEGYFYQAHYNSVTNKYELDKNDKKICHDCFGDGLVDEDDF